MIQNSNCKLQNSNGEQRIKIEGTEFKDGVYRIKLKNTEDIENKR